MAIEIIPKPMKYCLPFALRARQELNYPSKF